RPPVPLTDAAPLCIDPACGLPGAGPSQCRPVVCRAAGFSQSTNAVATQPNQISFQPRPCSGAHASPPPLCPNGFTWTIFFNEGQAFDGNSVPPPTMRCSPVTLANGAAGTLYAFDLVSCGQTGDGCLTGGDCCSGLCDAATNHCFPQIESAPAGYLNALIDVNGDRIPALFSAF